MPSRRLTMLPPGLGRAAVAVLVVVGGGGCGTQVETGQNLAKSHAQIAGSDAQPADPVVPGAGGGTSAGTVAGGTRSGTLPAVGAPPGPSGGAGSGAPLTCFGVDPQLTPEFQAFCAKVDPAMKVSFATAYDTLCTQGRLWNLLLDPCSWSGSGSSTAYRRVLAKTELADQTTQDFAFFAAYGVTSQLPLEGALALVFAELADPAGYASRYVTIVNSRVYAVQPDAGGYDYTVDFASSSATVSFRAAVRSQKITDNLTVVYDYGTSGYVLMKAHHVLRLMLRDGARTRMIVVDEKLLADGGNHAVAYENLSSVLRQFQERDYVNSTR